MSKRKSKEAFYEEFEKERSEKEKRQKLNARKYQVLDSSEIEHQEKSTLDFDGDIKITPFNINDELEEGHFDLDGNYYPDKDDDIKDNWLESIDSVKIHHLKLQEDCTENSDNDEADNNLDEQKVYRQMLELMKPKETVSAALKRLGGRIGKSASSKWLRKKKTDNAIVDPHVDQEKFLLLTELTDSLVMFGNMEIYCDTYEKLKKLLKETKESFEVDMFSN